MVVSKNQVNKIYVIMNYEYEIKEFNGKRTIVKLDKYVTPRFDINCNPSTQLHVIDNNIKENFNYMNLRDNQKSVIKKILDKPNGIINLSTGYGKTYISLVFLYNMWLNGNKCCVIVDRKNIKDQWLKSASNISHDIFFDIYIINTAIKKTMNYDVIVVDECHTMTSENRYKFLYSCNSKFLLGLSATIDKNRNIINSIFGDIIVSNIGDLKKQETDLIVYNYDNYENYTLPLSRIYDYNEGCSRDRVNFTSLISDICNDSTRNMFISTIINNMDMYNRKILVISDRIQQLKDIQEHCIHKSFLVISKNNKDIERIYDNDIKIIFGVSSMVKQAFDVPDLNTLLFACPKKSIVQIIGRIYRKIHETRPVIIDIIDNISFLKYFFTLRNRQYYEEIYNINKIVL